MTATAPHRRRPTSFDPVSVIEAGYAWSERTDAWLRSIASAVAPLDAGLGVYARIDDLSRPEVASIEEGASEGTRRDDWVEAVNRMQREAPAEVLRALYAPGAPVSYVRDRASKLPPEHFRVWDRQMASMEVRDVLGLFAYDADGRCIHVGVPIPTARRLHPRTISRLRRVAAHLTSAFRLRRSGLAPAPDAPGVEAVLAPSGRIAHAEGEAKRGRGQELLARAARAVERARGRLRTSDPDEALAVWRGLVDGRWSLVDHWDADGRRFLLARRNPPSTRDPLALTGAEGAIVAFVAMGYAEKYVAYLLGLAPSTVASHLAAALRKLRVRSRVELVRLFSSR